METLVRRYTFPSGLVLFSDLRADGSKRARVIPASIPYPCGSGAVPRDIVAKHLKSAVSREGKPAKETWIAGRG